MPTSNCTLKLAIVWEQTMWGGVDSYLAYLLQSWPSKFDEITIVTNHSNLGAERLAKLMQGKASLNLVRINSIFEPKWLNNFVVGKIASYFLLPLYFLVSIYRYVSLFKKHNFNSIVAQNGCYPGSYGVLASIVAAKIVQIPVRALVIHHCANKPEFLRYNFSAIVDKLAARSVTSVISISKATQSSLVQNSSLLQNENTHALVIYNGVPFDRKASPLLRGALDDFIKDNPSDSIIGVVGRIEPYKGHEDLIFAVAMLPAEIIKKLQVVIIGAGDVGYVRLLKRLCKELKISTRIHFLGYVEGESVEIISSLNLLLMLTRAFEGFGLSVMEAVACGVPVIATRVGAIPEILEDKLARVIDPSSVTEIASALVDYFNNTDDWKGRANLARNSLQEMSSQRMSLEYRTHLCRTLLLSKLNAK